MKTIEQIEEEYKDFQIKTGTVTSVEEFLTYIEVGVDDIDENLDDYKKELRENKIWALEAKVRNFFFFVFQEEDTDFYDEDNQIVNSCLRFTLLFKDFYDRIQKIVNEQNYLELTKLVDFACQYYLSQMAYFDYLRDQLEMHTLGFYFSNSSQEDNEEPFTAFLTHKLEALEKEATPKEKPKEFVRESK